MKKSIRVLFSLVLIVTLCCVWSCGRSTSRVVGKSGRQVLKVNDMKEYISISFDKRGSATVKDVTFLAGDGFIYTQEFKDVSPFEGAIRWVPYGSSSSWIQSRALSRCGMGAVNLEMPEDVSKVLGVDIGYTSKNERVKNLTYLSTDGNIYSREYQEGFLDRHLSGWLEIRSK